jgi:type IV pilus assembly protein PilQ
VNPLVKFPPLLLSGALVALAAAPGMASTTSITGVRLNPTATGLDLVFDTEGGEASNIFTVSQGNTLRADITRAQLNLPDGEAFRQANPAPGISEVTVIPLDANSVRVTINGTSQPPTGEVATNPDRVVMSIRNDGQATQEPTPVPEELVTVPAPSTPATVAQAAPPAETTDPAPAQPTPEVLVPNP